MQVPDIECVFESFSGKGSIFISNLPAAQDTSLLKKLGIGAILSVARLGRVNHRKEDIPLYLYIPADDHQDYELNRFFNQTYDFIEMARKSTNVLVHCMVGVSRSVTIVAAYLLKKYKYSLQQIFNTLRRKRRKINPNSGFIEQLKQYAKEEGISCEFTKEIAPRSRSQKRRSLTTSQISRASNKTPLKVKKQEQQRGEREELQFEEMFGRSLELKKGRLFEEHPNIEDQLSLQLDEPKLKKATTSFHSARIGKKDTSIEKRIKQIREKLLKSFHYSNYSSHFAEKIQESEKLTIYSTCSRQQELKQTQQAAQKALPRMKISMPAQRYTPQFARQEENKELFSAQLKVEPSSFYSGRNSQIRRPNHLHSKQ